MEFQDRNVWLEEGEFLIVPRGVEHRPIAEEEAHVLLFEPASTLNTGNVRNERTLDALERNRLTAASSATEYLRNVILLACDRDADAGPEVTA